MPGIQSTIARLKALRMDLPVLNAATDRLQTLEQFGSNPGALTARTYIPADLAPGAPLIVVLHGCTQSAAGYDHAAGWSRAADRHGFALLFPEQRRANNPNLCFNWFSPTDIARGKGEALSIRHMIAAVQEAHATDPARVFVTGLSAGGAMAAVMLATYPELFAGGAVIAGLPYGVARSVPAALERMRGTGLPAQQELSQLVRQAAARAKTWPTLSVWHGSADATVDPVNGEALVDQWRGLHDLPAAPSRSERIDGQLRRVWHGPDGRALVQHIMVAGLGHGTPLSSRGSGSDEHPAPYMIEAGISSTRHILDDWELAAHQPVRSAAPTKAAAPAKVARSVKVAAPVKTAAPVKAAVRAKVAMPRKKAPAVRLLHPFRFRASRSPDPITRTINRALRKAGLLR